MEKNSSIARGIQRQIRIKRDENVKGQARASGINFRTERKVVRV